MYLLFAIPILFVACDFAQYLYTGKRLLPKRTQEILNIILVAGFPLFYFLIDEKENDCCSESASFSPDHVLTIYVLVFLCIGAFFYTGWTKTIAPPLIEILLNALLLIGLAINIVLLFHIAPIFSAIGNAPIILLFIFRLIENQEKLRTYLEQNVQTNNPFPNTLLWTFLKLKPIYKFPLLLILCLPLLILVTGALLLFGQKPDSAIRVFTDTYKHGLSQWDYQCQNVECGGHYLCSVAANGHPFIVKPKRLGIRKGGIIMCNRQLLVSNAFEELLQERLPALHSFVRTQYNKVGNVIHKYYSLFNIKWISDFIYFLMKPLEWLFLIVLYTFDRNPENRIAKQYLSLEERIEIEKGEQKISTPLKN